MVRGAIIGLALLMAGCGKADADRDDFFKITKLEAQLKSLENRVQDLSEKQRDVGGDGLFVTFETTAKEWQWVRADPSMLRIGISDLSALRGGSVVTFTIRNPNAMTLRDCTASLSWWSLDSEDHVSGEVHARKAVFDDPIAAATFSEHKFPLADIAPAALDRISIGGIDCSKTD